MKIKIYFLSALILFSADVINSQWIIQPTGTSYTFFDVSFSDLNTGTAVAVGSKIIRTTNGGVNWTEQPNGILANLYSVQMIDNNTGYITGENGSIAKTTNGGTNWVLQTPAIVENFRGMYFINISSGYICGNTGTIMKTSNGGANWTALTSNVTAALTKIYFPSASTGYTAGFGGTILKTTDAGSTWTPQTSGVTNNLYAVYFINNDTGYTSGDDGKILKTTNGGLNWNLLTINSTERLNDIQFFNNKGSIAGLNHTLLRTTNGGNNWIIQPYPNNVDYYGLSLISADTGYACGDVGTILKTTTGGFSPPTVPVLTAPPNNAQNISITPLLDWDTASFAITYSLEISTDSLFTNTIFDTTGIINSQHQIRTGLLSNNIRYYWHVRGVNTVGNGPWSLMWNFTTIVALPLAPNLILPVNGAVNIPLNPSFDWDSISPAQYYSIQIAFDSSFSAVVEDITGIPVSNYTITSSNLRNNTQYFWRVSATNQAGSGPWSIPFKFSTIITIPPPPILVIPVNGAVNVSITPLLKWWNDISVINYTLQVAKDSTFDSLVVDNNTIAVSQYTIPQNILVNFKKYYWRVRTTNSFGTGNWSVVWNFTTVLSVPAAPVLLQPLNGATGIILTPLLDWDDNPFSTYRVQLSSDSLFNTSNLIINIGGLASSQYTVSGGSLTNNASYYWRVNATNSAGTGDWSVVWKFTTIVSAPIAPPTLIAPPNGSQNQTATPTLDWNDVFGATAYRVNVSVDSNFQNTSLIDTVVNISQFLIPNGKLSASTTYFWRVRAQNEGGVGPWSVIWNFRTGLIGINTISSIIPKSFKLYNNFPNPFNPSTKIHFDLPKADNVQIIIFNLLGQEISIAVDEFLSAGQYEIIWNGSNHASGIYLYRIITSQFTDTKKMVLAK
jgi:photosystem II stability/assembly factor-like uncharacterized protein